MNKIKIHARYYEADVNDFTNEQICDLLFSGYFIYYTQKHQYDEGVILTLNRHYTDTYHTIIICNKNINMPRHRHLNNGKIENYIDFDDFLLDSEPVDNLYDVL